MYERPHLSTSFRLFFKTWAQKMHEKLHPLLSHQNAVKLAKSMSMHETGCQSWNRARAKLMRKSSGARASAQQLNRSSAHRRFANAASVSAPVIHSLMSVFSTHWLRMRIRSLLRCEFTQWNMVHARWQTAFSIARRPAALYKKADTQRQQQGGAEIQKKKCISTRQ